VDDVSADTSAACQSAPTQDQPTNPTPDDQVFKDTSKSYKQKARENTIRLKKLIVVGIHTRSTTPQYLLDCLAVIVNFIFFVL